MTIHKNKKIMVQYMGNLLPILLFFSVIPLLAMVKVESYSAFTSNITIGSSISTSPNQTSYWLSPSTNFAFGFYSLSSEFHHYIIGIWLTRTNTRTLVWTANHVDPLFSESSIVFGDDGVFMLQPLGKDNDATPLFNVDKTAYYAVMQDNGNLMIYDFNSTVVWQSFDYPTDTLLASQSLKVGHSLVSSDLEAKKEQYKLTLQQDGHVVIYNINANSSVWDSKTFKKSDQLTLNLDTHGRLYLSDVVILKNFTNGEESFGNTKSSVLYRAKLDSNGSFGLYKDTFGLESIESLVIWNTSYDKLLDDMKVGQAICYVKLKGLRVVCIACVSIGLVLIFLRKYDIICSTRTGEVAAYAREVVAYNSDKS